MCSAYHSREYLEASFFSSLYNPPGEKTCIQIEAKFVCLQKDVTSSQLSLLKYPHPCNAIVHVSLVWVHQSCHCVVCPSLCRNRMVSMTMALKGDWIAVRGLLSPWSPSSMALRFLFLFLVLILLLHKF